MSYPTMPGDSSHSGIHSGDARRPTEPPPRGPSAPPIPPTSRGELVAFLNSFVYAWHGLVYAVRTQRNARVHMLLGSLAILLGIILRISPVEFAMVFIAITLVFIAEMFNTVAEACIDLVTREYHPLARIAKDVAAGAVLLNAMLSVLIGGLVFIPHLWPLAQRLFARL
ncbi:MAG TPA: diacylglycerol kinase family protein [Ktedonobacterales bacterium]